MQRSAPVPATSWRYGIQQRLMVICLLFTLIPIVVIGALAFFQARETMTAELSTTVQQLSLKIGEKASIPVEDGLQDLHFMAQTLTLNPLAEAETVAYLESAVKSYDIYRSIYVIDPTGKVTAQTGDKLEDVSGEVWFQQAAQGNDYASDIIPLPGGEAYEVMFVVSTPISDAKGNFQGVIAGTIPGTAINDQLMDEPLARTGDVFIVNRQGFIVSDPVPDEVMADIGYLDPVQKAINNESGTEIAVDPHTGETSLFAYMPLPGSEHWVIIGQVPIEELNEPVDTLAQRILLVAVLVTLILVPVIYYVTRNIVQPVRQLTVAAGNLGSGSYDTPVTIQSRDELGHLARTFKAMAATIQQRNQELEQRVDEAHTARERAEQSDKVKSAFLASMSHELRTPLNAVINFTRFVVDGDTGPVNDEQKDLLNEVINSARHLLNLINDVLDMSKIEAGSLNLFIEEDVSVRALLSTAVFTGETLLGDKPVTLTTDIAENLPLIRGDRQRIYQIALNLISNACKFTEQGEIRVSAEQQGDNILMTVKDTGPGIASEDQAAVFEAFKQTPTGLRQSSGGTGLGMPIARSLAEAHGGQLWLESEAGHGATFYVLLPVKAEQLAAVLA